MTFFLLLQDVSRPSAKEVRVVIDRTPLVPESADRLILLNLSADHRRGRREDGPRELLATACAAK